MNIQTYSKKLQSYGRLTQYIGTFLILCTVLVGAWAPSIITGASLIYIGSELKGLQLYVRWVYIILVPILIALIMYLTVKGESSSTVSSVVAVIIYIITFIGVYSFTFSSTAKEFWTKVKNAREAQS